MLTYISMISFFTTIARVKLNKSQRKSKKDSFINESFFTLEENLPQVFLHLKEDVLDIFLLRDVVLHVKHP